MTTNAPPLTTEDRLEILTLQMDQVLRQVDLLQRLALRNDTMAFIHFLESGLDFDEEGYVVRAAPETDGFWVN